MHARFGSQAEVRAEADIVRSAPESGTSESRTGEKKNLPPASAVGLEKFAVWPATDETNGTH
jgi:hypothetical protein